MKTLFYEGSAKKELDAFPDSAQHDAGFQLYLVQRSEEPDDWKPFSSIGPGVNEIRVSVEEGAFRVMYVAKFEQGVFVLHCFQKKTQKTEQHDIDIAKERYKALVKRLKK